MDFSLTTLFVVPSSYATPSDANTEALAAGELGIYDQAYAPITAGPVTADYIYIAQGRANKYLQGSKRSDKISASKIVEWYKTTGSATACGAQQVQPPGGPCQHPHPARSGIAQRRMC